MPALQSPPSGPGRPSYTAREPKDEVSRIGQQVGPAEALTDAGFRAKGGQPPAGPGAPRNGPGAR